MAVCLLLERVGRKAMIAQLLAPATDSADRAGNSGPLRWLLPAMEAAALASGNWPPTPDPAPSQWTCFPRVATRSSGADAGAVSAARDFTVATVRRWGVPERCSDIAVVVSELLTNALVHALPESGLVQRYRAIQLGLLQPGPCVLCVVADPSRRPPVPKDLADLDETGRGLRIVDAFSDRWGYAALGDLGKVVWAMFSTVASSAHGDSCELG